MLAKPTDRLKNFKVKLQPMLSCVGVAPPANQSFRSGWLGSWGGNMDYNGIREGVTVYLPVYQEGALLFVGDGHALEGDGELNGDALETSMNVAFTVDLIRDKSTQWPRFENDEYLMASGIAGSLQDALQRATTELARWLERDYKLSPNESGIILGTSIRYESKQRVRHIPHLLRKREGYVGAAGWRSGFAAACADDHVLTAVHFICRRCGIAARGQYRLPEHAAGFLIKCSELAVVRGGADEE